jgi:hypothetical protein
MRTSTRRARGRLTTKTEYEEWKRSPASSILHGSNRLGCAENRRHVTDVDESPIPESLRRSIVESRKVEMSLLLMKGKRKGSTADSADAVMPFPL